jgi:hypothetical protein
MLPKFSHLEVLALCVAAACLGAKLLAGTPFWVYGLAGGLIVAAGSFVLRRGWVATS